MTTASDAKIAARRAREELARWAGALPAEPAPAVVLGASVNGLSFARSLGRRGVPVLLLDSQRLLGVYTRFARALLWPPVEREPGLWIERLAELGARLPRPAALFVTSDAHAMLVARNEGALRPHFRFLLPDEKTLERIVDKRAQYEVARAHGIPIPRTHFPESAAALAAFSAELSYPCILKPYRAHEGRARIAGKVVVAGDPRELGAHYARLADGDAAFMVQEIVPGPDTSLVGYLAFYDEHACERAWITKRKLRQDPPQFGDGSLQVAERLPEVAGLSRRLLAAFGYRGFVGVEFKRDARDGCHRLMEINPRTVSGNQLAIAAGVDLPWIGYRHLQGDALPKPPPFRSGVRYVNEEWDLRAFLALRARGELSFGGWLRSLRGVRARAIGALDDPGPLLAVLSRLGRAALRRRSGRTRQSTT